MSYGQPPGYGPPGAPPGGYGAPPGGYGGAPPGGYGPPPGFSPPGGAYGPPGTAGGGGPKPDPVGIVSLVLGIISIPLWFCCYLGVPVGIAGIVCGVIAVVRINGSQGKLTGKGFAFGGIAASVVGFLIFLAIFVLYGAAMMFSSI